MSVVSVTSDGHVDVDWEYEVECPECKGTITRLNIEQIHTGEFYVEDGEGVYEPDVTFGEVPDIRYFCPLCRKLLFNDEEEAKRFLLSRSWEPDLLPMPLD